MISLPEYHVQHINEWWSSDGPEGDEVRLWNENGDLIAVCYYHFDMDSFGFHGYTANECQPTGDEPVYGDWRLCLLDQVGRLFDQRTSEYKAMRDELLHPAKYPDQNQLRTHTMTFGFTARTATQSIELLQPAPRGMGFASKLPEPFIGPHEPPKTTFCLAATIVDYTGTRKVWNTRGRFGYRGLHAPLPVKGM